MQDGAYERGPVEDILTGQETAPTTGSEAERAKICFAEGPRSGHRRSVSEHLAVILSW